MEEDLEKMRQRVYSYEREIIAVREERDRLDEEYRGASQRHLNDYSTNKGIVAELEEQVRKSRVDNEDLQVKLEY